MRKYNCVSYSRCLDEAADGNEPLSCEYCVRVNIREYHADDPCCHEEALACCRLLLAAFMEPEEPLMIHGFRIIFQDGHWVGIQKKPGQKRKLIRVGNPEKAESRIEKYLSMV